MIGIIDLGFSNVNSVEKAIAFLGYTSNRIQFVEDFGNTQNFSKVIFPGVGSFKNASESLRSSAIDKCIVNYVMNGGHFLGICLGMQLLFDWGFEGGKIKGLGLIKGEVKEITPNSINEKVPHNGWNEVHWNSNENAIRSGILDGKDFYFNHSYSVHTEEKYVLAKTPYGANGIISAVKKFNIYGTQFHPEKSQSAGLKILKNFIEMYD